MRLPKALAVCVIALMVFGTVGALALPGKGRDAAAEAALTESITGGRGLAEGLQAAGRAVPGTAGTAGTASPPSTTSPTGAGAPAAEPVQSLPIPTQGSLPAVPQLAAAHGADAIAIFKGPLSTSDEDRLDHQRGIAAVSVADTGTVNLAGANAVTFGVDPGEFRSFTPASTASVEELWQYLAAGSLVSSYDMANDRKLQLGAIDSIVPAGGGSPIQGWMGVFASLGLPGVDLLVDDAYSPQLGLIPRTAAVVSAPTLTGSTLRGEIEQAVPGATVELLRVDQVSQMSGTLLSGRQRADLVSAAMSRVHDPYVWGGAGPNTFDCSGLVQWSFARAGILMPRTAAEQFLTGQHISLAAAAPGDLLFWTYDPNDPTFVDHVAIYLGNGMMVVAPHTGLNVEVVPVPTDNLAGVVRVLLRS